MKRAVLTTIEKGSLSAFPFALSNSPTTSLSTVANAIQSVF